MTPATEQHLSPTVTKILLDALPEHIRVGILNHAEKIDYPVELVLEMAIAGFLDDECLNFSDCKLPHMRNTR